MDPQRLPPYRQRLELTYALMRRDLRAKASQTVLGFGWALVKPLFLTIILYFVFGKIVPIQIPVDHVPYWLHVLVSILTWQFVIGSITESTHSVVAQGHLLRKVPLDARVFPAAAVGTHAFHYLTGLGLVVLVLPLAGIWPTLGGLLSLVAVVLAIAVFCLTVGVVLSALQVYLRDTGSALELFGTAWFYGSPVIYPVPLALTALGGALGGAAAFLYLCNPAAILLAAVRRCLIYPAGTELPDWLLVAAVAGITALCVGILVGGNRLYFRVARYFADRL